MPESRRDDEQAVSDFLDHKWDPIGVYDGPEDVPPPGEYVSYARIILGDLYAGATADDVLRRFRQARSSMGLADASDRIRDPDVARELVEWWATR